MREENTNFGTETHILNTRVAAASCGLSAAAAVRLQVGLLLLLAFLEEVALPEEDFPELEGRDHDGAGRTDLGQPGAEPGEKPRPARLRHDLPHHRRRPGAGAGGRGRRLPEYLLPRLDHVERGGQSGRERAAAGLSNHWGVHGQSC